jgi:hypothetical protein
MRLKDTSRGLLIIVVFWMEDPCFLGLRGFINVGVFCWATDYDNRCRLINWL